MFKRLRQNTNNKNANGSKSPVSKSVSQKKKYSDTYQERKKGNSSEYQDFQLAWICDHLYQGQFQNNKKHGQGIMILNNGVTVVGNWYKGNLDGNCLFFTPFGGKIYGRFIKGRLQGYCIVCYRQNIEIYLFDRDKKSSIRTRFDGSQSLWVQSDYSKQGNLLKIIELQNGSRDQLPSFLNKKLELNLLYNRLIIKKEDYFKEKPLKKIHHLVMNQFEIYGYLDGSENPEGLGIIYSDSQIFAGNFNSGSLNKYGLILFENGLLYKGEMTEGKISGDGAIYDPNLDETKVIQTNKQGLQTVISEQPGFDISVIPFNIGKITRSSQFDISCGFETGIEEVCEQITKFYYKQHSMQASLIGEESVIRQNDDNLIYLDPNGSFFINNDDESREQEIQNISMPKSISGMPMTNAPKFEDILNRKPRQPDYPHLKEFEMSTVLRYPHKAYERPGMIYKTKAKTQSLKQAGRGNILIDLYKS